MSIVPVLEIIGEGIENLINQKIRLEGENKQLYESREFLLERLRVVERERDELQLKLKTVQDYADSLAEEWEISSKSEKTEESGC